MAYYLKHLFDRDLSAEHLLNNDHSIEITKKLYLNDKMADIFFVFATSDGEIRIPAHKLILAGGSDVFAAMFYGDLQENGDIKIIDASIDSFKEFLQFFYLNQLKLTFDNISDVMNLAHKYLVNGCYTVCDEFLKHLPVQDVCFTFELALLYDRSELVEFCEQEIRKFTEEVFDSDGFKTCSKAILERILKMDYLGCHENRVLDACVNWAKAACEKANEDPSMENLRKQLIGNSDCFRLIQFGNMNKKTVNDSVLSYPQLFTRDELLDLFRIVMGKEVESVDLNIFDRKTRKICCDIEFDHPLFGINMSNSESEVSDSDSMNSEWSDLKELEITRFCVNRTVTLMALETGYVNVSNDPDDLSADLYVLLDDALILQQKINFLKYKCPDGVEIHNYTKLMNPVQIEPFKRYQIRIKFNSIGYKLDDYDNTNDFPGLADNHDVTDAAVFDLKADGGIIYTFHFNNV